MQHLWKYLWVSSFARPQLLVCPVKLDLSSTLFIPKSLFKETNIKCLNALCGKKDHTGKFTKKVRAVNIYDDDLPF